MKRRLIAFLLMGSMLLQCTFSVAGAEIIVEEPPDIIVEESQSDVVEETIEEISPYAAGGQEENVGDGMIMDSEILWNTPADNSYWNTIRWGDVYWSCLNGQQAQLPNDWAGKVKWAEVNWSNIYWRYYTNANSQPYWNAVDWNEVDWTKMAWKNVDWAALKALVESNKIAVSFTYNGATTGQLITPVSVINETSNTIMSSCVTINIKGGTEGEDAYTQIPYDAYIIIVGKDGENYKLEGIWNSTGKNLRFYSNDFFTLARNSPIIVNGTPKFPINSEYWEITVDDSNCTFANTRKPLPEVTIKSKDGSVTLAENTDYKIVAPDAITTCGEYELTIEAIQNSSHVDGGEVKRNFTVHYADIKDFYTLEGIYSEITVKDKIPTLTEDTNGNSRTEKELDGYMYLKPIDNEALGNGRLPRIGDSGYESGLFNSDGFLKVEYRYESEASAEPIWSDTFDLDTWRDKHTSNILYVRVSVNESLEGKYPPPGNEVEFRYLKGSISTSIQINPYSLEEVFPDQEPKTKSTRNKCWYFAAVNPIPKEFEDPDNAIPDTIYEKIEEEPIQPVVYNGKQHKPIVKVSLYEYWKHGIGATVYDYEEYTKGVFTKDTTYGENIDAGRGEVIISFGGDFTGSITRYFEIQKKNIADDSVKIQAQDFLYDGNPHEPILSITDSEADDAVLKKGKDYSVSYSGNITSPGTVEVTVQGEGNYQGTKKVKYKIVPTSTIVVGTKLEQVANIPKKLDDQKYTGQPLTPEVVITGKNTGLKLVKDKDYTVTYLNNIEVGEAYAVVKGIGSYGGTYIIPFNITEKENQKIVVLPAQERDLKKRTLKSRPTKVKYTVAPKTSTTYTSSDSSIVTVDSKTGAIEYKDIGTAVITISAAESDIYNAATKELTVKVLPETPKNVAMKFVKGVGIIVTGGAVPEATQYQIRVQKVGHRSVFKNFDNNGPLSIEYTTKTKGKFNVWVRAYKVVDGVEHFSEWSKKKTLTVS